MSKRQMRRSVGLSAITYVRLWLRCKRDGVKIAPWLEEVVNAELDIGGAPTPTRAEAYAVIASIRATMRPRKPEKKAPRPMDPRSSGAALSGNGHYL